MRFLEKHKRALPGDEYCDLSVAIEQIKIIAVRTNGEVKVAATTTAIVGAAMSAPFVKRQIVRDQLTKLALAWIDNERRRETASWAQRFALAQPELAELASLGGELPVLATFH